MLHGTNSSGPALNSVIVSHPHALVREGLCRIVADAGFLVIGQVGDPRDLRKMASDYDPDIIVVDFRLIKQDPELIDSLKKTTRSTLAITAIPEEVEQAPEALKAGVKGYLSYSLTTDEFIHSLSLLVEGSIIVSNVASEHVKSNIGKEPESSIITDREKEVVVLVARGATNREISDELMVSQHTVKIHLHSILNKLNLKNRQQVAAFAIKEGLLKDLKTEDF